MTQSLLKKEYQGIIYRFIDFPKFIEMCETQTLTLVHHTVWKDDPYEGLIYQEIARPENHLKIIEILKELGHDSDSIIFSMLHDMRSTLFSQSWTKEKDKLWNLYPTPQHIGRNVRIQIKTENLQRINVAHEWEKARAFEIEYVEGELDLKKEISLIINGNQISFGGTLLRKRKDPFELEQEVRLMLMDLEYSQINKRNIPSIKNKIQTLQRMLRAGQISAADYNLNTQEDIEVLKKLSQPNFRKVSFKKIENFIETATVHPLAGSKFVNDVKKFCDKHQINFGEI